MRKFIKFTKWLLLLLLAYFIFLALSTERIQIDHIYVINLDHRKDRYEHMQEQLNKLNLPVQYSRFKAFDGNDVELVNRATGEKIKGSKFANNTKLQKGEFDVICSKEWSGNYEPLKLNLIHFPPKLKGELGCACSHKRIWQDIVDKNYKNVLIFEDDVVLTSYFDKYLSLALNFVPKDYNILFLSVLDFSWSYRIGSNSILDKFHSSFNKKIKNIFFKKINRDAYLLSAYILNKDGAEKLLEISYYFDNKIKIIADQMTASAIDKNILRAYVIKPLIAKQDRDKFKTDIGNHSIYNTRYDEFEEVK